MNADHLATLLRALQSKDGQNVRVLDVRAVSTYADYLIVCHGESERQVQALARSVKDELKLHHGLYPLGIEGMGELKWVLMDYGETIVHVFLEPYRGFYDLEGLWAEATDVAVDGILKARQA